MLDDLTLKKDTTGGSSIFDTGLTLQAVVQDFMPAH